MKVLKIILSFPKNSWKEIKEKGHLEGFCALVFLCILYSLLNNIITQKEAVVPLFAGMAIPIYFLYFFLWIKLRNSISSWLVAVCLIFFITARYLSFF